MDDDRTGIDLGTLRELEGEASLDEMLSVLSDPHARYTMYYLSEASTASLEELAAVVTGHRAQTTDAIAAPEDEESVRVRLYHLVLPELDDHGFVEFDADEKTVTAVETPPWVAPFVGLDE